jgi:hypothetical protein
MANVAVVLSFVVPMDPSVASDMRKIRSVDSLM